ncbi:class D sortase [Bacillus sp. Marseille-Q3570]|uniref:class D sortase n=1 Tax=Bacillus sp. Marseille-Q3570 TaxID=2963522 RepID=UPI0021B81A1F|nr:class D sortase [Bacillus sp. Marseille-Q3570]
MIIAGGVFLLSLFFIFYALIQLQQSNNRIEEALRDWDYQETIRGTQEMPIIQLDNNSPDKASTPHTSDTNVNTDNPQAFSIPLPNDLIGKMIIPKLNRELPIVQGTSDAQLSKGVGHYINSSMPGEQNNTVLAGHRDTVFRNLDELVPKDEIIVKTINGTFTYRISDSKIVSPDEVSVLAPSDQPILTLITCYPFNFIGNAPERYILTAELKKQGE